MSAIKQIQSTIGYAVKNYIKGYTLLKNPKGSSPYEVNMIKKQSTIFVDFNDKGIQYKQLKFSNNVEIKRELQVRKLRINNKDTNEKLSLYRQNGNGNKTIGRTTYGNLIDMLDGEKRPKNKPIKWQPDIVEDFNNAWFNRKKSLSNQEYIDRYESLQTKEKANHQTQSVGKFISTLISNLRNK